MEQFQKVLSLLQENKFNIFTSFYDEEKRLATFILHKAYLSEDNSAMIRDELLNQIKTKLNLLLRAEGYCSYEISINYDYSIHMPEGVFEINEYGQSCVVLKFLNGFSNIYLRG